MLKDLVWAGEEHFGRFRRQAVVLLRVDLQGEAHVLQRDRTGFFFSVKPSPDGRHLAFGKITVEANAWMIKEF